MTDVQREQIPLLWSTVGETMLAKGFRSNMEVWRLSAEERSCREGVYKVRRSEKQAGDESEKF